MTNSRVLNKRAGGFTLLELMIVGVIVGVLAMIALPWYSDYVKRGQIQDGTTTLSDAQVKMEQFFQDNHSYAGANCPNPNPTKYFNYGTCAGGILTSSTATTYTVTATGITGGPLDGFTYTINQNGAKSSKSPWTNNASVACWITRKGDSC